MKLQRLLSLTRKAIDEFSMIEEGDRIAVGISGGKDSLTLLYALGELKKFYPKRFTVEALTVSLGYENFDLSGVQELCEKLEIPYTVVDTEIAKILFEELHEEHPCSLCARLRKGAFNQKAMELGCNKIAYAHHKNDVVIFRSHSSFFPMALQSLASKQAKGIWTETPASSNRWIFASTT